MPPQQGEIYFATNVLGPEPHRVVVVSVEAFNRGDYLVVVPFTSKRFNERKDVPNCVPFYAGQQQGLVENCVAQAEQIQAVDKIDVDFQTGVLGRLSDDAMRDVIAAVGVVMGAACYPTDE